MAYSLPDDLDQRPVTIDGVGTLGRRIATVFAAGGSDIRIFDVSAEQREAGRAYVEQHATDVAQALDLRPERAGRVDVAGDRAQAADGAWLVIESVPENIDIKTDVFGELDRAAEPDAILASNSSSLPSRLLIDKVQRPERVLNMHFQQPPELNAVELMSCGKTDPEVIDALMGTADRLRACAVPCPARERRVHLQPHLGVHQTRVPDGRRGGRRQSRGRRRDVEDLHPS